MRIYLAGCETTDVNEAIGKGLVHNAFFSFYQIIGKKKSDDLREKKKKIDMVILDSGAHSFFQESSKLKLSATYFKKKKVKKNHDPEQYFRMYLDWLKNNRDCYDFFVELDIGELTGYETTKRWRQEIKDAGLADRCITVFHPNIMTWEDFKEIVDESQSRYIAIEGDRSAHRTRLNYTKYIKYCYEKKVRVHGFAMIKISAIEKFPFYSVDSASWKSGAMYGSQMMATKKGLKSVVARKKDTFKYVKDSGQFKFAIGESKSIKYKASLNEAAKAYHDLEKHYTALWESRGINWKERIYGK